MLTKFNLSGPSIVLSWHEPIRLGIGPLLEGLPSQALVDSRSSSTARVGDE